MINIFAFWRWHCIESLYSTLHLTPSLYSHFFLSLLSLTLSSISTLSSFSFLSLLISLLSLLSHLLSLYFFCKKAQLFNIHNKILPELSLTSLACFKCPYIRLADAHSTVLYDTCLPSMMQIIWGKSIKMLADTRVKGWKYVDLKIKTRLKRRRQNLRFWIRNDNCYNI